MFRRVVLLVLIIAIFCICITEAKTKKSKKSKKSGIGSGSKTKTSSGSSGGSGGSSGSKSECRASCSNKHSCGPVPTVIDGVYIRINDSSCRGCDAYLDCDEGYDPSQALVECVKSGKHYAWETATCIIKDCGPVPDVENGDVTLNGNVTTFGTTGNVTCDSLCFEPSTYTITCQADGNWTLPSCDLKSCSPPSVSNGVLCYTDLLCGTEATVFCNPGYIACPDVITCQANGMFGATTCEIDTSTACIASAVPNVNNGQVEVCSNLTLPGDKATVICDPGYVPISKYLTCVDGQFIPTTPSCDASTSCFASAVPNVNNGQVEVCSNLTLPGDKANVICDPGYAPTPKFLTCVNGQFIPTTPSCTPIGPIMPIPQCCENGALEIDLNTGNTAVVVGSLPGVKVVVAETVTGSYACMNRILLYADFEKINNNDCTRCINYPLCGRRMLKVQLELSNGSRAGFMFNAGDSVSNNGGGRDNKTNTNDDELEMSYPHTKVWGRTNAQCRTALLHSMPGALSPPVNKITMHFSNERLSITTDDGGSYVGCSDCLYALNGQPDVQAGANKDERIYFGINRSVLSSTALYTKGCGVCHVSMKWACPCDDE